MIERIPFVDLAWQHAEVAEEVATGFADVLDATSFVGGPAVAAFEREYAAFVDVAHCIGVANGTDAIEMALRALGIGPGAEVVVPANTFVATVGAVARAGARPVLVDVDDAHLLIDPDQVGEAMTPRTRAIAPVHLYGQAAPVERLASFTAAGDVTVVEDAAQSQGARRHGLSAGSLGRIAATSFYPGKNLGAYGDAGAVLTNDDQLAARVRAIGNHGGTAKYQHPILGFNSRLDTLQAVVLRTKLTRLAEWNKLRQDAADRYAALLDGIEDLRLPAAMPGNEHVWHLYVIRVPRRDQVLHRLGQRGIGVGIHYPVPVHLLGACADLGYPPGAFPVAEAAAREILSLPMFPGITAAQQERVVTELVAAVRKA